MFESKKKIAMWADCGDDFYYGLNGEKVDYELAVDFYEKAEKKKHPHATYMLGVCYELGKFVEEDMEYAEILYEKAAKYGDEDAKKRLKSGKLVEPSAPKEEEEEEEDYENDNENVALARDYFLRKKYKKAFPLFEQEARDGNSEAQYYLGLMYLGGYGVKEDPKSAAIWFGKAAKQGHKDAQEYIDDIQEGEEVEQEIERTERAIKSDLEMEADFSIMEPYEIYNIGVDYLNGTGGKPVDPEKALEYFLEAAEQGHISAQNNAGTCYYHGKGVEENNAEAEYWYKKAAENGHVPAFSPLAEIYHKGYLGEPDCEKAVYWYEKAATTENNSMVHAQEMLVDLYSDEDEAIADAEKAVYWLQVLAENGNKDAQEKLTVLDVSVDPGVLALAYLKGESGWEQDDRKARYWRGKAVENGNEGFMLSYGLALIEGKHIEKNCKEGMKWIEQAIEAGEYYTEMMLLLGELYEKGEEVEKDYKKALHYYKMAHEYGDSKAEQKFNTARTKSFTDTDINIATSEHLLTTGKYYLSMEKDEDKAIDYFELAAIRGNTEAAFLAFQFLFKSDLQEGSERLKKAFWWLNIAAKNGESDAVKMKNQVESLIRNNTFTATRRMQQPWRRDTKNKMTISAHFIGITRRHIIKDLPTVHIGQVIIISTVKGHGKMKKTMSWH